ncbi:acetyl-CoA carboxylase biotin carboxyl carrier protein [Maricaulis sp.]|uniref:acetyl-CoA carboxylase biotin carboxyl carrier protein n=1 Tax=unclassified Maricaulis TaxID=2632371 RepID=UPI001B037153|nr:acetyl-CoA carboxylase biotin carboxyl carrier protein [Maricaulis sp.]MBO6798308.1 acetyl-CoA carboxylase biotin carboxyl carrier protein [Maricaulis sp.]
MSSDSQTGAPLDTRLVRDLAKILRDKELTEIEVEHGELKLRIAREITAAPVVQTVAAAPVAAAPAPAAAPAAVPASPPETPAAQDTADMSAHPGVVTSPMVGTAYLKPNPDSENFVKVGDNVKQGDTILLVEAMKTFNPITAEKSGKIAELLVEDGQPVEYGEPLFILV